MHLSLSHINQFTEHQGCMGKGRCDREAKGQGEAKKMLGIPLKKGWEIERREVGEGDHAGVSCTEGILIKFTVSEGGDSIRPELAKLIAVRGIMCGERVMASSGWNTRCQAPAKLSTQQGSHNELAVGELQQRLQGWAWCTQQGSFLLIIIFFIIIIIVQC